MLHLVLLLALCLASSPLKASSPTPPPAAHLINAGFENSQVLTGWKTWIYTADKAPIIRADPEVIKEGRQSILIEASEPADIALGQVIALPPASLWQVRGWVKTENLVARDTTDTSGTIHVQTAEAATLARAPSTFGTSSWKEISTAFRVPAEGKVKVVLFFIGYGKGTGKMWIDDVRLESLDGAGPETIRITSQRLSETAIDQKQGGQFIEPLCHLLPSMLAQQVASTSFEAETLWKVAFKKEIDKPYRPWYPDGAVHLAHYSLDTENPYNGKRSLRIDLSGNHTRAGISQNGFYIKSGLDYVLHLHLRGTSNVRVRASLHGDGGPVAVPLMLGQASEAWRSAEGVFHASRSVENATLTLDFEGPGALWLDRVYLIGSDAILGLWREDVVQAIKKLNPGVIRFGGSALETYEWVQCIGPWDKRAPFLQNYWGGLEENFVGVEEFVQLCQNVNAEPLICVRWTGKTPAEAAAEVEYFNGSTDTPWGRRRAAYGHPEPYHIKYWQIGNEVGGQQYDASVRAFAEAMRKVDANIKVLSSFPSADTLREGEGFLDYLCPHHYGCADLLAMEESFNTLENQIRRFAHGQRMRLAVTEWNTTAGDWDLQRNTLQTLANALSCARYHNLLHRHADSVEIAIRSNLIDSFGSGIILTGPGWLYVAPTYHAQCLYARAAGSFPLRIERHLNSNHTPLPWQLEEPDLSATLSADGATLSLYGVNSTAQPLELRTTFWDNAHVASDYTAYSLHNAQNQPTAEITNSRDEPDAVKLTTRRLTTRGTDLMLSCAPLSLTLYEFTLQHQP